MKKYLVDVFLPATGQHYNVLLPAGKRMGEATRLLVSVTESLSNGDYRGTPDAMLLRAENGAGFDPERTVHDSGIRNASRLILI